jgi:hypothetical protein
MNSSYIGWKFVDFMKDHEFYFFTFVLKKFLNMNINMNSFFFKNYNPLKIHCGYVETEIIVPFSFV